jgi:hypothetical protein
MGHFWSQRPEVMRNGARGGYMGKAYTKKEHDKCKQVAEAFQELYAMYGDMCVLDAGDFGFVHLKWFRDGYFDGNTVYTDSREMFDDLWEMWMDYVLLAPVKGTDREELDYDELYAELPEDKKTEYEQKRQELLELSGLND